MLKYVNEFTLNVDHPDEYVRRHDEIWPEMIELMDRAGLVNYSIWNTGCKLYEYYECEDIEKALSIIKASEVKQRWDKYMEDLLGDPDVHDVRPLKCMFDLDTVKKDRVENE